MATIALEERDDPRLITGKMPDLALVAYRSRFILLAAALAGMVLGILYYVKAGPTYAATARVLVSKRSNSPLESEGPGTRTYGERGEHVGLILSRLIVAQAVKIGKLDELPTFEGDGDVVETILDDLRVKRTVGNDKTYLNVFDISFESPSKDDAVKVVTAVIQAYREYLDRQHIESASEGVTLIETFYKTKADELKDKERALLDFRTRAPLQWRASAQSGGTGTSSTSVHHERIVAIETDRQKVLLREAEVRSKLKTIREARDKGESADALELLVRRFLNVDGRMISGDAADPSVNALLAAAENRLLPLVVEEAKLLRDYGDDYPAVKSVRTAIEKTVRFYRDLGLPLTEPESSTPSKIPFGTRRATKTIDLVDVYVKSLEQELDELKLRDEQLATRFDDELGQAKRVASFQQEDENLAKEIQRLRDLLDIISKRLSEMSVTKNTAGYTLKEVSPPMPEFVWKRPAKFISTGIFGGLILSFALVFTRAWIDTTLRSVADVQEVLQAAVIGRVPLVNYHATGKSNSFSSLHESLHFFHHPGSLEAEAYRSIRSTLFVGTQARGYKLIQLTSPEPDDGKTTLVSNLALAMAQSGKSVLLIDCDLRRPQLQRLFGIRNAVGLAEVLAGQVELASAMQLTEMPGLTFLGSGQPPANPAEMLSSTAFASLLAEAKQKFDYVLVDTPPLNSVSDPGVVSTVVDATVLVVRLNKSTRSAVKTASETLTAHGAHLVGVLVNDVRNEESKGYPNGYNPYVSPAIDRTGRSLDASGRGSATANNANDGREPVLVESTSATSPVRRTPK